MKTIHKLSTWLSAATIAVLAAGCDTDQPTPAEPAAALQGELPSVAGEVSNLPNFQVTADQSAMAAPPSFTATLFAAEFVVTGSESGVGEHFFPSNGDGTFGTRSTIPGLGTVDGLDVADVDGDGDNDFLVCNANLGGEVYLYTNDATGTFATSVVATGIVTGGFCTNLRVADFNGDGSPDFTVGDNRVAGGMFVYLQSGPGAFTKVTPGLDVDTWSTVNGNSLFGVAAGDVDGDGLQDILVLGYFGIGAGQMRFYKGDGTGQMAASTVLFNIGSDFGVGGTVGLGLFDVEGDGDLDIIAGGGTSGGTGGGGTHFVYTNNGTGTFTAPSGFAFDLNAQTGVDAFDFDADGDDDLVVATFGTKTLQYVENTGGSLVAPVLVSSLNAGAIGVGAPTVLNIPPEFVSPPTPPQNDTIPVLAKHDTTIAVQADDPDSPTVTLTATLSPGSGETFTTTPANPVTGTFSWTPVAGDVGFHTLEFIATDGVGGSTTRSLTIRVLPDPCEGLVDCQAEIVDSETGGQIQVKVAGKIIASFDIPPPASDGKFAEPVVVTTELLLDEACHHDFLRGQDGPCLSVKIETLDGNTPTVTNANLPVTVAVCQSVDFPEAAKRQSLIYRFETETGIVVALQNVDDPLDCSKFIGSSPSSNGFMRFASGLLNRAKQWLAPRPAVAAVFDEGLGGFDRTPTEATYVWAELSLEVSEADILVGVKGEFDVEGTLLDFTSADFDPENHAVRVTFGDPEDGGFEQTIPPGSFERDDDEFDFEAEDEVSGIEDMTIDEDGRFEVEVTGVDLTGIVDLSDPDHRFVSVTVTIGVPASPEFATGAQLWAGGVQFDKDGEF